MSLQQHLLLLLPRMGGLWVDADSDDAALLRRLDRSNGDRLRLGLRACVSVGLRRGVMLLCRPV